MLTESAYNQKLRKTLKDAKYVVIKHADRFTTGVPDMSVSKYHKTWWLEGKVLRAKGAYFHGADVVDNKVQLAMMCDLEEVALAYYVLYRDQGRCHLVSPTALQYSIIKRAPVPVTNWLRLEEVPLWLT